MKITSIDAFAFRLPTRRDFSWASLQAPLGGFVFVEVSTDEGISGIGEATPLPDWGGDNGRHGGETQAGVIDVICGTIAPALLGLDPTEVESAHVRMDRVLRGNSYARCAVDIALHDIWGKALGVPVYRLLGGAVRERAQIAHMIGIMPTDEAVREALGAISDGIQAFQIKGGRDPEADIRTVHAVREAVGPDVFLRLDANQGYGRAKLARRILDRMAGVLDMVEQPVRDIAELAELRRMTKVDIIADESCWDEHDALALVGSRAADAVSIYLAKAGGFARARRVAAIAEAAGLPCDVNGSIESAIGTAANMHFALASRPVSLACVNAVTAPEGCRSDAIGGRYYLDDVVNDAFPFADGGLRPPEGPGLGVTLNRQKLERFREAGDRRVNRPAAVATEITPVVHLTRRLVAIDARSGEEGPVADLVEEAMRGLGYRDIRRDRLGNVVGYVGPQGTDVALLFDSHMDVVAPTGAWSVDPFGGDVRDNRLYGRGATDMKGALAASLCGVAAAARTGTLTRSVAVSASVLEETVEGGALAEVLDSVRPAMMVICEPSSLSVKIGQRGRIEIILAVSGVPAHAAHPDQGKNAIHLAARALVAIEGMPLPEDPILGAMAMVPTDIISDPYPLVSALPERVVMRFDRRIGTGESRESVLGSLKDCLSAVDPSAFDVQVSNGPLRTYTGVEVNWERHLAAWAQESDQPLAVAAAECLSDAGLEVRFGTYGFCTNGSESAGRRNIATIGLGPGRESDAHTVDESISVGELNDAVKVYRNLVLKLAGGGIGSK